MRIDVSPGTALPSVYLWFTATEAAELRDALTDLIATDQSGWHAHISSADYESELTIARDTA
jgi:hypothetical protein